MNGPKELALNKSRNYSCLQKGYRPKHIYMSFNTVRSHGSQFFLSCLVNAALCMDLNRNRKFQISRSPTKAYSRGNQLIHVRLTRKKSIGSAKIQRVRPAGRQSDGSAGRCLGLRYGYSQSYVEEDGSEQDLLKSSVFRLELRSCERWQDQRFEFVRWMVDI